MSRMPRSKRTGEKGDSTASVFPGRPENQIKEAGCRSCLRILFLAAGLLLAMILTSAPAAAQQKTPVATSDQASGPAPSGTVVDPSGAAIAGATVLVRSANGTVQETAKSDSNGSFTISRLSAGG